jgi:hypothetical protein
MGQFSWICSVSGKQILSEGSNWYCWKCEEEYEGKEPALLHIPSHFNSGEQPHDWFYEPDYEGYGEFNGMDAYTLLARMNAPELCPSMLTPTGKVRKGKMFNIYLCDTTDRDAMDSERHIGIDLFFNRKLKLEYPIKITTYADGQNYTYEELCESNDDPNQGWQTNRHEESVGDICSDCWGG